MEEQHQPTKKPFRMEKEEEEEDRISDLQDGLLIDIISRLPTTKEAIRTGTLSKRWQHLWPYVHNLIFINDAVYSHHYNDNDDDAVDPFYSFVDKTLAQCRQSKLIKFHLDDSFIDFWFEPVVSTCTRYAITRNVQDLELTLGIVLSEELLGQGFFVNSCLTRLRLEGCEFNPTGSISWRNLKSFFISYARLDEGLIQNILSGSPVLETLELDHCFGFRRVDSHITSKSVKKFVLSGYNDDSDYDIEINAPYIVSLTLGDIMIFRKLLLLDVSSLVKAELHYAKCDQRDDAEEEMLKRLLLNLSHVKELKNGV